MMAEPGDELAARAGGHRHLRASHTDREQVIEVLKAAFVQGRLAKDEFDQRLSRALESRTSADLAPLAADLPAGLARAELPRERAREWPGGAAWISREKKIVRISACGIVACPSVVAAVTSMEGGAATIAVVLLTVILFTCLVAVPVSGLVTLHTWYNTRSGQPPLPGVPPRRGGSGISAPSVGSPGRGTPAATS